MPDPVAAVRELLAETHRAAGEESPDFSDDQIREALAAHEILATEGKKDQAGHCHDDQGHWTGCDTPGAIPAKKAPKAPAPGSADPAANRPSKPEERHEVKHPVKAWNDPPPKQGKKGVGKIERPRGDASQTAVGDHSEKLAQELGFRNILPEGRRSNLNVAKEGSSIDVEFDHSGRAYELKVCKTTSTEYRMKAKASEKDAKLRYARKHKLKPHTLVGVRDEDRGEIHFYASKQPGLIGSEVNNRDYDYVGKVAFK